MTPSPARLRLIAALAATLALGGCISLLPKTKPAHLYRFGAAPAADVPAPTSQARVGVFRANSLFQRESAGDRILTVTGGQAAYVAEARWVAPAATLWDQAVLAAFDADPGPTRLVLRGEPASTDYVLRVDVRTFETRYEAGPKAPPTVVVRIRAVMVGHADRGRVMEQLLEAKATARRNHVSDIVAAYDQAVGEVLQKLIVWTDGQVVPPAAS